MKKIISPLIAFILISCLSISAHATSGGTIKCWFATPPQVGVTSEVAGVLQNVVPVTYAVAYADGSSATGTATVSVVTYGRPGYTHVGYSFNIFPPITGLATAHVYDSRSHEICAVSATVS